MKNCRFAIFVLFILLGLSLKAQIHYESNISVGAKGGVSISRTFFNPNVPQGMKIGGVAGFTFRYIEEKYFGLVAELNFEQRGLSLQPNINRYGPIIAAINLPRASLSES